MKMMMKRKRKRKAHPTKTEMQIRSQIKLFWMILIEYTTFMIFNTYLYFNTTSSCCSWREPCWPAEDKFLCLKIKASVKGWR